ncbi:glycosyltransferase family protein [Pedobacter sp. SYSU D00535]|uniref:glycosyltransferase family protein n=1 Tax=Pedobacter sp. SYSU D00535 TaxID=2810308 RepID=UPI001A95BDCE|nr:glycosyltransferase family protein [Pedobacter sp. SYSU D00535]
MRILFAVQGTGNGHISRAREIVPLLKQYGTVDMLISGTQADVLPEEPLQYRFHGFSFVFGKKGGVDHWKTYKCMNLPRLWRDIKSLPLKNYDLIINDFEPVTAWACRFQGRPSVALSHQAAFLSKKTPRPIGTYHWQECLFSHYAPATHKVGFHFDKYDNFIHTPVIRSEIRNQDVKNFGHITVYLPAYHDKYLVNLLKRIPEYRWEIFSKHAKSCYTDKNISVRPINNELYNKSVASSAGLLTGGGFESPAEALFLGKKVMVVPMRNQYEQLCNAEAARHLGIPVLNCFNDSAIPKLKEWLSVSSGPQVHYPDETASIVDSLVKKYSSKS